jgi:hypothetical protein
MDNQSSKPDPRSVQNFSNNLRSTQATEQLKEFDKMWESGLGLWYGARTVLEIEKTKNPTSIKRSRSLDSLQEF